MSKTKRLVSLLLGVYLSIGFVYAIWLYSWDLRTFVCEEADSPHGYVTVWSSSFRNPGPETCARRGFTLASIASIPFMTVVGVPVLIVRRVPRQLWTQALSVSRGP